MRGAAHQLPRACCSDRSAIVHVHDEQRRRCRPRSMSPRLVVPAPAAATRPGAGLSGSCSSRPALAPRTGA
jgi:hypothetical protein